MWLKFFQKPSFGLDISDYSIEMISLKGTLSNPRLFAMGRTVLKPGVVEDGKILNKEILKKSLRNVIESPRFGKIASNKLIFALPESKTFIHIFDIPEDLKKKEEQDYIKSQASETFPYPSEDLYSDFRVTKTGKVKEVLLVASPKSIVNDYLEIFKSLSLKPLVMGIESESLSRSLIQGLKETVLIADIGARTTNFSIFDKGNLRFSYTIEIAGNAFSQILSDNLKISFEKAEQLKKQDGLNPNVKEGRIFLIIQKEIQAIIQEIRKIEQYFQKKEEETFSKIILTGGSAMLPYLPEYLNVNLQKQVLVGDPWTKVDIAMLQKKKHLEQALEINPILYATCIGSALRGLADAPEKYGINFLTK